MKVTEMTQMGLSNTGTEIIRVDSEILADMSPTKVDGTFAGYSYIDTTTDLRYMNYNTRTSKLWNTFAKEFKDEIRNAYITLRNAKVYTVDNIFNFVKGNTDDIVGEIYFNKDAASKYLSQTTSANSTYLQMLHGNRAQKYKKFLKERLIFLDTVFGYEESASQPDTLNSYIGLRSDAAYGQGEGTTIRCYLGISVYSPQYVTITVGSGADATITAYVGPESRYKDPDTKMECEGTLFSFPIRGINKEFGITGAGNIKQINRLQSLNLTEARIEKALKLLELDVSYSNRMSSLKVGNNKYLRTLNCTNSYQLGTATESQMLDLSNCSNLKSVDISYTKFTGISFPRDTVLNHINLTGSYVKNITIDGAEFLQDINITGCENINRFELNRCNGMEVVNVSNSTIQNFIVTNCENVREINLSGCKSMAGFDVTNSNNIEKLNMKGNTSTVMEDLKLYSMYNLKELIVSETTSLHTIRLPKYLNEAEAFKAANGEPAILWEKLERLDARASSLMKIQYGSADIEGDVVDMSQLTNLTYLGISRCTSMVEIKNINYTGAMNGLFQECKSLAKISGTLTNSTNTIANMFYLCLALNNIDGLTLNFSGVVNSSGACYSTKSLKTPMAMKILKACGATLTNASSMFYMYECQGTSVLGTSSDTTTSIPSNFFEFNTGLTTINSIFSCTRYTSVPGDLLDPMAESLSTADSMFVNCPNLTDVGSGLFKNKPKLTSVSGAFGVCDSLTNYINEDPNIFDGSENITNTKNMFRSCRNLVAGELGLGQMFYPLKNLTTTAYMFYHCDKNFAPELANGILANNSRLTTIEGMFQSCSKLKTLPDSLFRVNLGDNNKLQYLVRVKGLFAHCSALEGNVSPNFFLGAENITDAGDQSTETVLWSSGEKYPSGGVFEGTKISGYFESFLYPLTKVTTVRAMFKNCTSLNQRLYYVGSAEYIRNNTVDPELFSNNKALTNADGMFQGCALIEGCIPELLFDPCRKTIATVSNMFNGCSTLTGYNLDATGSEEPHQGICSNWFKDCIELTNVSGFLRGCSNFVSTIPEDVFAGCTKLQNVSHFMNGCAKVNGTIPRGLFDDCRSTLNNVEYLFSGCTELTGAIPTGEYEKVLATVDYTMVAKGTEGAFQVVEVMEDPYTQVTYSDVVNISPGLATYLNASGNYYVVPVQDYVSKAKTLGLLSECVNLTSAASLFNGCQKLTGAIPHDLFFTSSNNIRYTNLTNLSALFNDCRALNDVYIEEETGIAYLFKPGFFDKCPNVTSISSICNFMTSMKSCELHPQLFDKMTKLASANSAFLRVYNLTGGITQLFKNSISSLTDARCLFAYTKITSVGNTFLNNGGVNNKLVNIMSIFQGCSSLQGTSPEFWNGNKFKALGTNKDGYWGALADCTNLSNYTTASNVSSNWTTGNKI